ncbi:MAG: endonuclease/exonuclease/phosphatase family protein [Clostridia bacterium]|nr:endonuclease/exonuclease/phosphatase family protein [Clostridia bacterium]
MRLLTLNTHGLMEPNLKLKQETIAEAIYQYKPDVVALQEIMQPKKTQILSNLTDICSVGKIPVKCGNYLIFLQNELKKLNLKYSIVWLGIKSSYNKYDEGLSLLTTKEINDIDIIQLSPFDDYNNWKTRKALGVKIENQWFYSVHLGWWTDKESPQEKEILSLREATKEKESFWLMGDFNSPANERETGYDMLTKYWYDSYLLALNKDDGITVKGKIDGWEDSCGKRIDYIFTSKKQTFKSSQVIFNGDHKGIVSDHFGILLTI